MKKSLLILLSAIMLFSFTGCESDDDSQELSKVESELAEIGEVLGKVANDYLNANITKSEAEEKLKMLKSRVNNIDIEADSERKNDTSDKYYSSYLDGVKKELSYLSVKTDIESFIYNLTVGETDKITKIRDEYYKE